MSKTRIEYIFLTIKSEKIRFAVGIKKRTAPMVLAYSLDSDLEEDNYYSFRAYLNALTEQEGQELQHLVEQKQTSKAHNFLLKTMRKDNCLGPCGPVELSDLIPDEWYDGCEWALDMIESPKINGIYSVDLEDEF